MLPGRRLELQTGADAAALAIAQDCGSDAGGTPSQTAQALADANRSRDGEITAAVTELTAGSVTVRNSGVRTHVFAPILGIDSTSLAAEATATWEALAGGTAQLPLAFSWCEWQAQTEGGQPSGTTERVIVFPKKSNTGCAGPSAKFVPGGFEWLDTDPGTCETTSAVGEQVGSSSGTRSPTAAPPADFTALLGNPSCCPCSSTTAGPAAKPGTSSPATRPSRAPVTTSRDSTSRTTRAAAASAASRATSPSTPTSPRPASRARPPPPSAPGSFVSASRPGRWPPKLVARRSRTLDVTPAG